MGGQANVVRVVLDDIPAEQRVRLKCLEIAMSGAAHLSTGSIRQAAADFENFVRTGSTAKHD